MTPQPDMSSSQREMREGVAREVFLALVAGTLECQRSDVELDWVAGRFPIDRREAFTVADALLTPAGPIASALAALERERDEALAALTKINAIRNSIIGLQTMNWSEHIYPLVAALNAAGIEGMDYPEARENFGTMLERTNAAEAELATLRASAERIEADHAGEIARLRATLSDVEGKCELARSVYATENTATPSRAAQAFAIVRDVTRAALTPKETPDA